MNGPGSPGGGRTPRVFCLSFHASYRCCNSGACCTSGWHIPVEKQVRVQLDEALGSGRLVLPQGSRALFEGAIDLPPGTAGILQVGSNRACACYEADRRTCAIHRQLGEVVLPSACRHFPRVCLVDRHGTSVTLSHYCPTAAALLLAGREPAAIVEAPAAFAPTPLEGLDAHEALPPLLHPRMLADREAYRAWERFVVEELGRGAGAEDALGRVVEVTEDVRRWRPGRGTLEERVLACARRTAAREPSPRRPVSLTTAALALDALVCEAVPADLRPRPPAAVAAAEAFAALVAPAWDGFTVPVGRYLAARAFGSWCSYQGRGLRTVVCSLVASLAVVRVEAAHACEAAGRALDAGLLAEAFRSADLVWLHLASREELARRLGAIEDASAEEMLAAL